MSDFNDQKIEFATLTERDQQQALIRAIARLHDRFWDSMSQKSIRRTAHRDKILASRARC